MASAVLKITKTQISRFICENMINASVFSEKKPYLYKLSKIIKEGLQPMKITSKVFKGTKLSLV